MVPSTEDPEPEIAGLLFSDIEGSTRLAQRLGSSWAHALERHRSIARAAFERHHGREIGTEGDLFFVVFTDPLDAAEAAWEFRTGLAAADWPADSRLQVRIGIHAGTITRHGTGYVGVEVHRAARIAAGGHGGQVLVSGPAGALIGDRLSPDFVLRELGRYRLNDFDVVQTIFQLDGPGQVEHFPPLRLAALALTNLRPQRTSFVGREREMMRLRALSSRQRLITLVGVGGTGKTRLMLEVGAQLADRFPDGIWLVELATITDPGLVASEIVRTLGAQETPGRSTAAILADFLGSKSLLLLVDNCEHLIGTVSSLVDDLLATCPNVAVMTSSREALGIAGESVFQVPSLAIPPSPSAPDEHLDNPDAGWLDEITASEAVRLFVDRAAAVVPSFSLTSANAAAVLDICRRLDGIPLAIELAAARVNVMSPPEIASGLNDRFRLLTGGRRTAVPRQQTLQALIDWSWSLLPDADRRSLAELSVFAGGWTHAAAAVVASGESRPNHASPDDRAVADGTAATIDMIAQLVERSLVEVEHAEVTRYRLLETIRQFARDRLLEMGASAEVRDRHLDYFLALAAGAGPLLRGPDMLSALRVLDFELDNVRAALEWSFESQPEKALQLSITIAGYWRSRSFGAEAVERSAQAAEVARTLDNDDPVVGRDRLMLAARALAMAAYTHALWGRATEGRAWSERAVALARELGDPDVLVEALNARTMVAAFSGEFADVFGFGAETLRLAAETGDWWTVAMNEAGAVMWDLARGDPAAAEVRVDKATRAAERTGNPFAIAFAALSRGRVLGAFGRTDEARRSFGEAIRAYEQMGDRRFVVAARSDLAHALRQGGLLDEAEALYGETIHEWQHVGNLGALANQLECLAYIAIARDRPIRAARLLGAAEALRERAAAPMPLNERAEYGPAVERLRSTADSQGVASAWAAGRLLPTDDAVTFARATDAASSE